MEWVQGEIVPIIQVWSLLGDGRQQIAVILGYEGSWAWTVKIDGFRMALYRGHEADLAGARAESMRWARRVEALIDARWTAGPGGRMTLLLDDRALAIVSGPADSTPATGEGWRDWHIPDTRIGGESLGMFEACVVASKEAAEYWSKPEAIGA